MTDLVDRRINRICGRIQRDYPAEIGDWDPVDFVADRVASAPTASDEQIALAAAYAARDGLAHR